MITFNIDLVLIAFVFLIDYADNISGPQHHHYLDKTVNVYEKYQCPKYCETTHPHFVYYNSPYKWYGYRENLYLVKK